MNTNFFNNNFSFNLRKDVRDTTQTRIINGLILNTYISRDRLATTKSFINNTIYNLFNLNTVVKTKPDIEQINNIVQSTVQETVDETVQSTVSNVIDTQIQKAISVINFEKQNAINEIQSYNGEGLNASIQSAITQLNDKTQAVAVSVSNQISNMPTYTKEDLLQKIDFLFEMFYHANSDTIMELYPL